MSARAERNVVVGALAGFAHVLRGLDIEVDATRLQTAVGALEVVDPGERDEAYWALRCALVSRQEHVAVFDAAFEAFWSGIPLEAPPAQAEEAPAPEEDGGERGKDEGEAQDAEREPVGEEVDDDGEATTSAGFSAVERLRSMDFREYGPEELASARRVLERLARSLPRRRSRRMRPASRGSNLDRRATLRSAMRTQGHPLELAWRRPATVPRRLLFLVDISGSMEPYARVVLMFLQAVCRVSPSVEAFSFGTRLTRLTRRLAGPDPSRALESAAEVMPDWAGGTRIGGAIAELNRTWGSRGVTRGAVVVIVSDGWERGDVSALAREMERLHRAAHTVIWVNPLAGDPGYEPLVAGMAAALPHVDVFLPGHDLRSVEALADVLESLPDRRGVAAAHPARRGENPPLGGRNPRGAESA